MKILYCNIKSSETWAMCECLIFSYFRPVPNTVPSPHKDNNVHDKDQLSGIQTPASYTQQVLHRFANILKVKTNAK